MSISKIFVLALSIPLCCLAACGGGETPEAKSPETPASPEAPATPEAPAPEEAAPEAPAEAPAETPAPAEGEAK